MDCHRALGPVTAKEQNESSWVLVVALLSCMMVYYTRRGGLYNGMEWMGIVKIRARKRAKLFSSDKPTRNRHRQHVLQNLTWTMSNPSDGSIPVISDNKELESYGVIRVTLPESFDCEKWATELSQLTPAIVAGEGDGEYAFYRNILEESEFPFTTILESSIGEALVKYFPINDLKELRLDDAFCVHYNMTQDDNSGARHLDPSDMTVNMCLEKTSNVEASHVLFYGSQALEGVEHVPREDPFIVEQVPGFATIHWGHHPHETMAMTRGGRRTNIVLTYCYVDSSRSDVALRSCYG